MTTPIINILKVDNPQQLEQCLAIRLKVFVEEQQVPPEEEIDAFDAHPSACAHFLITVDGKPAATSRSRLYEAETEPTYKLQRIAVHHEYRGTGLGRVIVGAMERDAAEAGAKYTLLDAQCQAEPFYHKMGYVTISEEVFLDAGIPHVRMKKQLHA
jgi:predicted GNAT family N-acyltransferase